MSRLIWAVRGPADRLTRRTSVVHTRAPHGVPRNRTNRPKEACPVANIKSQMKRIKTNEKSRQRNKAVKSALRTSVRRFNEALIVGDADKVNELAKTATRAYDKAVSKGVVHPNNAANHKSAIASKAAAL